MTRLTRAESQARTRELLLATASTCFLRDGYVATSLEGIAEAAGFSKGAVYSNFKNKDELCLEVLQGVRAERAAGLGAAVLGATSLEARLDAFEAWAERHIGDRAWTSLEIEFALHVRHDAELSARLARDNAATRQLVASILQEHAARDAIVLPMPTEEAALALLSLGVGLGVQRALDPSVSVRPLGALVRLLAGRQVSSAPGAGRVSPAAAPTTRRTRRR